MDITSYKDFSGEQLIRFIEEFADFQMNGRKYKCAGGAYELKYRYRIRQKWKIVFRELLDTNPSGYHFRRQDYNF